MNRTNVFAAAGLLSVAVLGAGCEQDDSMSSSRTGSARGETMQATGQPGMGAGTGTTASGVMTGTSTTGSPGAAGEASSDTHHGGPGSTVSASAGAATEGADAAPSALGAAGEKSTDTHHGGLGSPKVAGADAATAETNAGSPGQTASNAAQGPGGIDQAALPADADAAQLAAAEDKKDAKHEHDDAHHAKADAKAMVKPSAAAPKEMQVSGTVSFAKAEHGVKVMVDLKGLTPNAKHGFHIHEKGDLSDPKLVSAGAHFNPGGKKHGGAEGEERHGGDLGNITADDKGHAMAEMMAHGVTLDGEKDGIVGRSVIVHAKPDDEKSDPSGNSGDRIAGGVIEKSKDGAESADPAK